MSEMAVFSGAEKALHEAKLMKLADMFMQGEEEKIQWAELWDVFCSLPKARQEAAYRQLTPNQLRGVVESASESIEATEQKALDQIEELRLQLGISRAQLSTSIAEGCRNEAKAKNTSTRVILKESERNMLDEIIIANSKPVLEEQNPGRDIMTEFIARGGNPQTQMQRIHSRRTELRKMGKIE